MAQDAEKKNQEIKDIQKDDQTEAMVAPVVKKKPNYQGRRHERLERHDFGPWLRKIPCRRKLHPTPVILPEESHGQTSLWATVHGVANSQTQLK